MGRPPSNGGPSFRFNATEVAEMEAILQAHNTQMPSREMLVSLAEKFSTASDRSGKVVVQMKQVWNWFQNRRYALRAKASKTPVKLSVSPLTQNDLAAVRNVPQAPQHVSVPSGPAVVRNVPQVPQPIPSASVQSAGRNGSDNSQMEFEAKSARDGAWYDVATFISHRSVESADPEVLVRLAGFGPEEDEWVNIRKHVRQRSLPCESSECVSVLPGDLILCFQEGKEQALYFDAHVLDAQRRRHDVRGCRCRFLVRYDHDQSEEIVPLRKVCRRPETDYRMQQLHAESANMNRNKTGSAPLTGNIIKVYTSPEATQKLHKAEVRAETKEQPPKAEALAPVSHANASATTAAVPNAVAGITSAAQPLGPVAITTNPIAHSNVSVASLSAASTTTTAVQFNNSGATVSTVTATPAVAHSIASGTTASMTTQDAISHVSASATSAVTSTTTVAISTAAAAANDSVVTTSSPTANFDVFGVTKSVDTTMTPANSDVSRVTNTVAAATAPVANSNSSIAPTNDPIAADVITPVAESKVFPENASEVGATSSAQNADPQLAEIKVSNSTSSDADTRGSSGENILQG